jgi:flavin-dependent dehydrogenase
LAIRRPALDRALAEAAIAAGTQARFGEKVTGLVGSGGEEDPVRGVVLGDGRARLGTLGLRSRRARLLCVASAASCLRGASIRMQKPYTRRSWRS